MPGDGQEKWEHAEVSCRFSGGKIVPLRFVMGASAASAASETSAASAAGQASQASRVVISRVNYTWTERQGKVLLHFFSVSDGRDTYRLCFDPEAMSWRVSSLQ